MVEMMRKGFFLLAVLVAAGAAEASAQEVTARIAGLEGNAEYMEMLREEASLQAREDSVTMVVNRVRRQLRDDPARPIWCTTPISANSFRRPTIGRC